mmetsp:Transcript_143480/g.357558  ORF Transcript_143480/g.357558 Transcript_143480/m.357558 type:complete len:226 (-) Transcript_143480:659-1336(-)
MLPLSGPAGGEDRNTIKRHIFGDFVERRVVRTVQEGDRGLPSLPVGTSRHRDAVGLLVALLLILGAHDECQRLLPLATPLARECSGLVGLEVRVELALRHLLHDEERMLPILRPPASVDGDGVGQLGKLALRIRLAAPHLVQQVNDPLPMAAMIERFHCLGVALQAILRVVREPSVLSQNIHPLLDVVVVGKSPTQAGGQAATGILHALAPLRGCSCSSWRLFDR